MKIVTRSIGHALSLNAVQLRKSLTRPIMVAISHSTLMRAYGSVSIGVRGVRGAADAEAEDIPDGRWQIEIFLRKKNWFLISSEPEAAMWFLRANASSECENEVADIVEREVRGDYSSEESDESSGSDEESGDDESGDDESGESGDDESGEESGDEEDQALTSQALREDVDAAHHEILTLRERTFDRIEALEATLRDERARTTAVTAAAANVAAQSALRTELSRAQWDNIDREFAVETRRIFIEWLRALGRIPEDANVLHHVIQAMALPRREHHE